GMGAFLAGATGAPLMAILMIFEMTLSYQVMLPLMLSCVMAYFISRSLDGSSMYEITIRRNREEQERLRLRRTQMRELIRPAETVLPLTATLEELTQTFIRHSVKYVYIVDEHNRLQGQVALQDLTSVLTGDPAEQKKTAADYLRRDFLPVITPEMSLSEALQRFLTHQGERLPIVQSTNDPVLLGASYKTSLLDASYRLSCPGPAASIGRLPPVSRFFRPCRSCPAGIYKRHHFSVKRRCRKITPLMQKLRSFIDANNRPCAPRHVRSSHG